MTTAKIVGFLWLGFTVLWVGGFYTPDIFRVLFCLTLLLSFLNVISIDRCIDWLRRRTSQKIVIGTVIFLFVTVIGSILFDYEGINGVGDLTQFLQALYNYAKTGQPIFGDAGHNYFFVHRSLSIYFLGALFKIFPHPWIALLWQGFFLTAPCIVTILWYRALCRNLGKRPEPLGDLLACFSYALMPTFLAQTIWPYTFHIMSFTFLALAYLFYFEKKWLLWALALVALAFEKEEYSFIAIPFALLVILENLLKKKSVIPAIEKGYTAIQIIPICLMVIGAAWFSYFGFHRAYPDMHSFEMFYGHLGRTPFEAVKTLLINPYRYWTPLIRKESLIYLWFFFATSFLWFKPKWGTIKYIIPVLPLLLLNCLSSFPLMQLLKDFYALPIVVGIGAVHIFGILEEQLKDQEDHDIPPKVFATLIIITLFPLMWNHQATSRSFVHAVAQWKKTRAEQALLSSIRQRRDVIVCGDERPSSYLALRPNLFGAMSPHCQELAQTHNLGNIAFVLNNGSATSSVPSEVLDELNKNGNYKTKRTSLMKLIESVETPAISSLGSAGNQNLKN